MDNYYSLLGCSEDASKDEIRKQYKQLALKLHPDKNSSMDHLQFQQLSEAVNTLTDNKEKYKYDSELLATRGSNKIITDEVNFEEFSLEDSWYIYDCRCGGQFLMSTDHQTIQCDSQPTVIDCNGCSLSIRVLFQQKQS